jgi:hypothetical protein
VEQRWTSYPQTWTVACVGTCEPALHVGMCWRDRERGPEPDGDRCRSFGDLTDTDVRARDSLVRIGDSTRTRGPSTGRRAVRANASTTRGLCRRGFHRREIPAPGDMRVVGRSLGLWRVTPRQAAALGWTGRMCVLLWIDSSAPWAVRLYPTELAAHVLCRSVLIPCH